MDIAGDFELWDSRIPFPMSPDLSYPKNVVDVVVHRAEKDYQFLHDNAVVWHGDTLFAAWYNCPKAEIEGSSCIRTRRSRDGGRTWSDVSVIAEDRSGAGVFYVPVTFLSHRGQLWAFVSNMAGHDLVTHCEAFKHEEKTDSWASAGYIAGPFLPNNPPLLMENGNFILAGRMTDTVGTKPESPAVAISKGESVAKRWDVVSMMQGSSRPHTDYPESSVWPDGSQVTAVVRGRLVFSSTDYGRTWSGPFRHNLPAEDSKPFAVQLSTGQRCLLWNYPDSARSSRNLLTIAVSRPGEEELAAVWKLRDGYSMELEAGPEWSYPYAVECEGSLYVIYTSEKKHSVMSIVPLASLAV